MITLSPHAPRTLGEHLRAYATLGWYVAVYVAAALGAEAVRMWRGR